MTTTYTTNEWVNQCNAGSVCNIPRQVATSVVGWTLAVVLALLAGCGGGDGAADQKVGGSVTGVLGPGLILKLNGRSDLSVDTDRAFRFPDELPGGSAYAVTVHNHPFGQRCRIDAGAAGRVSGASESVVTVSCASSPPADVPESTVLRGTVEGLVGSGLVIRNGADTVSIAPGATEFSFPTPFPGSFALLEFLQQPTGPTQACTPIRGQDFGRLIFADLDPRRPLVHLRCTTISLAPPGPGVALDRRSVAFAGEHGGSVAPQSVFARWAEADKVEFISVTSSDGAAFSAEQFSLSGTSAQVWIRPASPTSLRPGTHTGTVTVSACTVPNCSQVAGTPLVINVSYEVRQNQPAAALSASARGVAFSEVPGAWRLLRTLTVSDSAASPVAWRASADAPWVTVTRSGSRGGELAIHADATSLAEGFHQATVSIEPDDPGAARPETVRVGLYKSSAPRATRVTESAGVIGVFSVADPIRPVFYQGGGDSIVGYHAHTGQATGILRLPGHSIKTMATSDDGAWLYLLDDTSGLRIVVVNLDTLSVHKVYPLAQAGAEGGLIQPRLVHAVVDGRAALLLSNVRSFGTYRDDIPPPGRPVLSADTGALIGYVHGMLDIFRVAGNGGSVLYADGTTPDGVREKRGLLRMELRSNSLGNVYGAPADTPALAENEGVIGDIGSQLAVSVDGNRVAFVGNRNSPFRVLAWNGVAHQQETGFPLAGDLENHLHFDVDGRLLTGLEFIDFVFTTRFRLFGDTGTLLRAVDVPLEGRRSAPVTSSDGFTLMTGEQLLDLRP
jgi:hypothetical protein